MKNDQNRFGSKKKIFFHKSFQENENEVFLEKMNKSEGKQKEKLTL